uniref:CSON013406 protein n=1 Tax=Culicoides sonorensis TaxID=179676 RepID=A0A336M825_CULSO
MVARNNWRDIPTGDPFNAIRSVCKLFTINLVNCIKYSPKLPSFKRNASNKIPADMSKIKVHAFPLSNP